jgi:hypothetical protein
MKKNYNFRKVANGFVVDELDNGYRVIDSYVVAGNLQALFVFLTQCTADFEGQKFSGDISIELQENAPLKDVEELTVCSNGDTPIVELKKTAVNDNVF